MGSFKAYRTKLLKDDEREKSAKRIGELRAAVKDARLTRDQALDEIRSDCAALRRRCVERKEEAKELGKQNVEASKDKLRRGTIEERRIALAGQGKRSGRRTTAKERAQESDDEVRGNIPPEYVSLFNRVRRQIRGTEFISRTEAFLQYVEEHPNEVLGDIEDETDRMIEEHEAALREGRENPAPSKLFTLGRLTALAWRGGRRTWPLAVAPTLAYDARGRLYVVARSSGWSSASSAAARREHSRTHWGLEGPGVATTGVVAEGPFRRLGPGTSITYTTAKGSKELVDWVHTWGEGAKGQFVPPTVVEHSCKSAKCAGNGQIVLLGGSYRVTDRGIVG